MNKNDYNSMVDNARRRLNRDHSCNFQFINLSPIGGWDDATSWSAQASYITEIAGASATVTSTAEHADPQAAMDAALAGLPAALNRRRRMRVDEIRAEAHTLDQRAIDLRSVADALERSIA